ncbi:MAG: lysophospholipid acyltransferase family protein [Terriglobia bacterium]|jgi:1-acyl-sn-glycerol-3-phosphate acyltransferase
MIRAIFVSLVTFVYILVVGLPFLIHAWLTKNTDKLYHVGIAGARLALWLSGVRLEVHGVEKIPRGCAAIYMPNHQSNCDPPAVISILPPVLVMAKQEFFRVPVLGPAMVYRGFIPVDRKNRERAIAAVERAVASLKAGNSFLAFPEGTRSPDGHLQKFKKGLFVMAIKAGALIVPISASGARKIMPKGQFVIRPGRVRITIHDPISAQNYTQEDRQELIDVTRQAILKGLDPDEWPV